MGFEKRSRPGDVIIVDHGDRRAQRRVDAVDKPKEDGVGRLRSGGETLELERQMIDVAFQSIEPSRQFLIVHDTLSAQRQHRREGTSTLTQDDVWEGNTKFWTA